MKSIKLGKVAFTPKGEFDAHKENGYDRYDMTYKEFTVYVSLKDGNTSDVTNTTDWMPVAVISESYLRGLVSNEMNRIASAVVAQAAAMNPYEIGDGNHSAALSGTHSRALGNNSHAEGTWSIALGDNSHAEGEMCTSRGKSSHAGGNDCVVQGNYGFAHGEGLKTTHRGEVAFGRYNDSENKVATDEEGNIINYLVCSFGGGHYDNTSEEVVRTNLFELWRDGSIYITGKGETKILLQDTTIKLLKLMAVLVGKGVITSEDLELTDEDLNIITNSSTVVGMEVKPYGAFTDEELATIITNELRTDNGDEYYSGAIGSLDDDDSEGNYYYGAIGSLDDDDDDEGGSSINLFVDLGSQSSYSQSEGMSGTYLIDESLLNEDLYSALDDIWALGETPLLMATLGSHDLEITVPMHKDDSGNFIGAYYIPDQYEITVQVTEESGEGRYIAVRAYDYYEPIGDVEDEEEYYYYAAIGDATDEPGGEGGEGGGGDGGDSEETQEQEQEQENG